MKTTISRGKEIKIFLFLFYIFIGNITTMFAQNYDHYYLEIKEGYELGGVTKTTNPDQTLTLNFNNQDFASVLNNIAIYEFEKAFPTAQTPRLQRVYIVKVAENFSNESSILQRLEVNEFAIIDESEILFPTEEPPFQIPATPPFQLPNDYSDPITGERNTLLDLIKAPLAWSITAGDPNVLIGFSDAAASLDHPDLNGQIFDTIFLGNYSGDHGVASTGTAVAKANNGQYITGVAYDSKAVFAYCAEDVLQLTNALLELTYSYPNIRVINCSWGITADSNTYYYNYLLDAITEINALPNPPLIVAAAHNQGNTTYYYPASFDSTISVTTVGHRFPIGFSHDFDWGHPNGDVWQIRSWKDVHLLKPHIAGNTESHNHNDKVDVSSPAHLMVSITNNYNDWPDGYRLGQTTSATTPVVSGIAALVFAANPSLNAAEVRDIIRNTTDDIYYIPYNQPYIGQLGTGRVNAYRAVKTAWCMDNPGAVELDLAMQDSKVDYFEEPNTNTPVFWYSDDIWTRNQDDGILIKEHENPEYDPNNPSYVYVQVTNSSCVVNSGTEELKLYWSKANTALTWPNHWDGSLYVTDPVTGQNVLMGDEVGTLTIPPLTPGESTVLKFEWYVPNPEDYININYNPWHFCLLGRIVTPEDPMTVTETGDLAANILNNNNIVMKNTTVVDIIADAPNPVPVGGVVMVGNPTTQQKTYELQFSPEPNEFGKAIYDEAEVTATLDAILYNAWDNGGKTIQQAQEIKPSVIQLTDSIATIGNITLNPGEMGTVYVSFNFLTKELTQKRRFTYHLMQKDVQSNEVIGGETFEIRKQINTTFTANAGNDEAINKNESVTIIAGDIGGNATYNWYDPQGNLIYTGTDLTITPQMTQTYQLEVVSNIDGFKDYDQVTVTVNPYFIDTLVPNPASSQVTVNYEIDGSSSAYLMVVNTQTGSSNNYILDTTTVNTSIDVSAFETGLYNIILVCDGATQNAKTLLKQ